MLLVYRVPDGPGWYPINYMVELAAELLGAELLLLKGKENATYVERALAVLPRQRGDESCLVICPHPRDLLSMFHVPRWKRRFRKTAAWIIDSFWTDVIPRVPRTSRLFDQLFVTTLEDVPEWRRRTGVPTEWLAWGTDALRFGSEVADRDVDLLRVGRQPPEWDDDSQVAGACEVHGIRFHGRPAFQNAATQAQAELLKLMARTRFVLAFSNRVSPAPYTHPRSEYVTARWTDALAAGATVAGTAPRSPSAEALFWPGATLELGTVDRRAGLGVLKAAVGGWSAAQAQHNHRLALERLDWRWRLDRIATFFEVQAPRLEAELQQVRDRARPAS